MSQCESYRVSIPVENKFCQACFSVEMQKYEQAYELMDERGARHAPSELRGRLGGRRLCLRRGQRSVGGHL